MGAVRHQRVPAADTRGYSVFADRPRHPDPAPAAPAVTAVHRAQDCVTVPLPERFWPVFRDGLGGYVVSRTRLRSRGYPARPYIWRLSILRRLTLPSTLPELQGRVRPLRAASRSSLRPRAKECRAGRSLASAVVIHWSRRWPWRLVRILAKSVTWPARASRWGHRARAWVRLAVSWSSRWPGRVVIQRVMSRVAGGGGGAGGGGVRVRRAWR